MVACLDVLMLQFSPNAFFSSLQPLIECYTKLKEQGGTVNLQLTNTWLRHYQVNVSFMIHHTISPLSITIFSISNYFQQHFVSLPIYKTMLGYAKI